MTDTIRLPKTADCPLKSPRRNNYFHGKLLDAYHFELETDYFNWKRQLINRLVNGFGVVCGLDVKVADDCQGVTIMPGVAIDQCGNEIIVPCEHTEPLHCDIGDVCPPAEKPEKPCQQQTQYGEQAKTKEDVQLCNCHVVLCYCEKLDEPAPSMAGCPDTQPGVIREGFEIRYRPGHLDRPKALPHWDLIDQFKWRPDYGFEVDFEVHYECMVKWISEECFCPSDPCIPLANIWLKRQGDTWFVRDDPKPDINIRPIVYTNDLLRHLLFSLARVKGEQGSQPTKAPQQK